MVIARDARALADGLQRAADAIAELFTLDRARSKVKSTLGDEPLSMLMRFSDADSRKLLKEFIAFCRAGRFEVN